MICPDAYLASTELLVQLPGVPGIESNSVFTLEGQQLKRLDSHGHSLDGLGLLLFPLLVILGMIDSLQLIGFIPGTEPM